MFTNQLENITLDLILVSEENIVSDVVIDSPLSTSDHNLVQFKINVEGNIKLQVPSRLNYKQARWNILKEKLPNHSVNINKDGNEYWNNFKYNLLISQEECIPRKNIKNGQPDPSLFCHDIKIKILNKDKLYKKCKSLSSETNFIALTNIKKEIKKLIRQAKRKEEIRIADLSK